MAETSSTIFVRNLPYNLTHAQLEEMFEGVGPVKSAFVIADPKDPNLNRGFGFVQYAVPSDAEQAMITLSTKTIGGRKLLLELAAKKGVKHIPKPAKPAKPAKPQNKQPKKAATEESKTKAVVKGRSILICGLGQQTLAEGDLKKHFAVPGGNIVLVTYPSPESDTLRGYCIFNICYWLTKCEER